MKFSSVVRYIQKTKECRNSFLGILIFHEIMFHVSMFYSLCHFLLTATELDVAYQLDGASLFFTLARSRCPPCPTASSRRPQSSRRWTPRLTPSWPARPAGLGSCSSRRPTSTPPGTPASRRPCRLGRPWGPSRGSGVRGRGCSPGRSRWSPPRPPGPPWSGQCTSDPPPPPTTSTAAACRPPHRL